MIAPGLRHGVRQKTPERVEPRRIAAPQQQRRADTQTAPQGRRGEASAEGG